MGLASKVQAAGGVPSAPPAPAAFGSQNQTSGLYPQPTKPSSVQATNGLASGQAAQQPQFPGQFGAAAQQSSQAQPGYPSLQGAGAPRPGLSTPVGQQQTLQRPGQQQGFQAGGFGGQQQAYQQGFPGQQPSYSGQAQYGAIQAPGQQQSRPTYPPQSQSLTQHPPQVGSSQYGQSASSQAALSTKLQNMIRINRLETFYPPNKLQAVVQRISSIDWR